MTLCKNYSYREWFVRQTLSLPSNEDPLDAIAALEMPLKQSTGQFAEDEVTKM